MTTVTLELKDGVSKTGAAAVSLKIQVDRGNRMPGQPPTDAECVGIMLHRMWESGALMHLLPLVCMDIMQLREKYEARVAAAKGGNQPPLVEGGPLVPAKTGSGIVLPPELAEKMRLAQEQAKAAEGLVKPEEVAKFIADDAAQQEQQRARCAALEEQAKQASMQKDQEPFKDPSAPTA